DDDVARERIAASHDRSFRPMASVRHLAAVLASPDRTPGLRGVTLPTLVVHGAADPLIGVSGGEATAAAVPGAELIVVEGMGHDLPEQVWSTIVEAVTRNAKRAG
ncbi:MAG: alpha/beta hydrolase, partial [Umezawaea sp.]